MPPRYPYAVALGPAHASWGARRYPSYDPSSASFVDYGQRVSSARAQASTVGCSGKKKAGGKPCCDGCAKGGGCGDKAAVGRGAQRTRGWRVGAERALPWTQVAEFNVIAEQFITEVSAWLGTQTAVPVAVAAPYNMRFNLWQTNWRVWFATTAEPGFFDLSFLGIKIIAGDKLLEFDKLRVEYDELRRIAIDLGAPVQAPEAPEDKNVEIAEDAAGTGKRIADVAELAFYGLLIAGAGYAAVLLAPAALAAVSSLRRKK